MKKQFGISEDDELETVGSISNTKIVLYNILKFQNQSIKKFCWWNNYTYNCLSTAINETMVNDITRNFVSLILDLSYVDSYKTFPVLKFNSSNWKTIWFYFWYSQKQIKLQLKTITRCYVHHDDNYILKSRNGYNTDNLYKCLSDDTLKSFR